GADGIFGTNHPGTVRARRSGGQPRIGRLGITPSPVDKGRSGAEAALGGEGDVGLLELFDVDVLEGHHSYVLHEPGGTVHVPHPGIVHLDLEVDLAVDVAYVKINLVGQVEAALGLHDVGELADDVAILPIELQLHLGFVFFEIFGAHSVPPSMPPRRPSTAGPPWLTKAARVTVLRRRRPAEPTTLSGLRPVSAAATFAYEKRCCVHGPCSLSASECSSGAYPLCSAKPYNGYSPSIST